MFFIWSALLIIEKKNCKHWEKSKVKSNWEYLLVCKFANIKKLMLCKEQII